MKYRVCLTIGQIRKHNAFLKNCANHAHSPILKALIMSHMIIGAEIGQTVLKGTISENS